MKKLIVRKLGVTTVARFVGLAQAVFAVVAGVFIGISSTIAIVQSDDLSDWAKIGATVAAWVAALVLYPFVAFVLGWLYGAVVTLIANVFLRTTHGIEVDVEETK